MFSLQPLDIRIQPIDLVLDGAEHATEPVMQVARHPVTLFLLPFHHGVERVDLVAFEEFVHALGVEFTFLIGEAAAVAE